MAGQRLEAFRSAAGDRGIETRVVEESAVPGAIDDLADRPAVASTRQPVDVPFPDWVQFDFTKADLDRANTGITAGTYGVASDGAILLTETDALEGPVSLYPDRHIFVLDVGDILADVPTLFHRLVTEFAEGRDDVVIVSGPSATSDMGELVRGVHGPSQVHALLVEQ